MNDHSGKQISHDELLRRFKIVQDKLDKMIEASKNKPAPPKIWVYGRPPENGPEKEMQSLFEGLQQTGPENYEYTQDDAAREAGWIKTSTEKESGV